MARSICVSVLVLILFLVSPPKTYASEFRVRVSVVSDDEGVKRQVIGHMSTALSSVNDVVVVEEGWDWWINVVVQRIQRTGEKAFGYAFCYLILQSTGTDLMKTAWGWLKKDVEKYNVHEEAWNILSEFVTRQFTHVSNAHYVEDYSLLVFDPAHLMRGCEFVVSALDKKHLERMRKIERAVEESFDQNKIASPSTQITKASLFDLSVALAYELGKAYQMGQNCQKEIASVAPPKAAGLFINYFNEQEVQRIMNNYERGMKSQKGRACQTNELQAVMNVLKEKMSNYIKLATPHTRPYSEK